MLVSILLFIMLHCMKASGDHQCLTCTYVFCYVPVTQTQLSKGGKQYIITVCAPGSYICLEITEGKYVRAYWPGFHENETLYC